MLIVKLTTKNKHPPSKMPERLHVLLVKPIYTIFQEVYDGFQLGEPKLKDPAPRVFSLDEA